MKKLAMLFVALVTGCQLFAQTQVSGTVLDGAASNEPMIGATVMVEGTSSGTVTDIDGNFTIALPQGKSRIVVSSVGYKTQTVNVAGQKKIQIIMQEDADVLDEVVVIGYGTMKKRDLSGAMSQLKGDDLMQGGATDLLKGMQGKVAGVQINQSDGAPGGGMSIVVRGANSFSTSSQPLFIVDGVPLETGSTPSNGATGTEQQSNPLSFINPHDIENIEILKDASATAIYGSRGANGVVIVTTKRGKAGKPKVEFNGSWGFSKISKKLKMLDPVTYAYYQNEQLENDMYYLNSRINNVPYPGKWGYQYFTDGHANYNTGKYTGSPEEYAHPGWYYDEYGNATELAVADWQDEIFQTSFQHEYNLSVSGGDDRGYYSFSGNYLNQDGIIKNSGYERYALRANIARKIYDWMEIGTNISFTSSTTNFANTLNYNTGVVRSALLFPPTYGPDMDTTQADELNWLAANPAAYVRNALDELDATNFFSSSFAEFKLTKWLKFRQNIGLSHNDQHRGSYYDRHTQEGKAPTNGKASRSSNIWKHLTSESMFTFDYTIKDIHKINAVGVFAFERSDWDNSSMLATNFPDDLTKYYDMGRAIDKATISSDTGDAELVSYLGRVNYSLLDRYYITASARYDGSSKFKTGNKWAFFPSFALAWRASDEKFIKDLNIFSNLKFRLSYGKTGNQGIGSYRTLPQLATANYPFNGSMSSGGAMVTWRGPVDADIKWETTSQYNAGIDFGFLNNRLTFTIDYYHKKTVDLLQEVKIPGSTGFSNKLTNSGNVTNDGLELTLGFDAINNKDWKWNFNANMAFNKNKIGGLTGDQYANTLWYGADNVFIQRNGCPIGAIFGYVEDGFYDNEAEVRADPQYTTATAATVKAKIGEIKYVDLNGDGQITDADRTIIGDTNPKVVWGFTNNLSWKDLTLSFMLQGSHGNDIFNGNLQDIRLGNIGNIPFSAYNSRWTAENPEGAHWPKASSGYERNYLISDRYIEDGSYIKLKSITLTYNWNHPFKLVGVERVQFSLNATNVFTITDYSWYDPDVNAFGSDSSRRGVDIYSYPANRTFTFGLNVIF
ncbi:MAG: TonB-dependent receptor [Prevotella sp.]|nr:TonB-dependent receptor [Prevotella sp.]